MSKLTVVFITLFVAALEQIALYITLYKSVEVKLYLLIQHSTHIQENKQVCLFQCQSVQFVLFLYESLQSLNLRF